MSIKFHCEACGTGYNLNPSHAGKHAKCKVCGTIVVVPQAMSPPALSPPAPLRSAGPPPVKLVRRAGADAPARSTAAEPATVKQALVRVRKMIDRGGYLESVNALHKLAPHVENNPAYFYLAGLAFSGLGNYPHALQNYNQAIKGGVRTATLYANKGKAELETSQYAGAIQSLDTALDLAGTDVPDYMADLARAYEGAHMFQDAGATWNALQQISPNHPALVQRERERQEKKSRKQEQDVQQAMLSMQREQRASDTACWICIIIRIVLECM